MSRWSRSSRRRSRAERSGSRRSSRGLGSAVSPGPGRPSSVRSRSTAGARPLRGAAGVGTPVRVPTRTRSSARATARPRPSGSPWARAVCTASTNSPRPGAARPRSRARSPARRTISRASAGPEGWSWPRRASQIRTAVVTSASASRSWSPAASSTVCCHSGSRMPAG